MEEEVQQNVADLEEEIKKMKENAIPRQMMNNSGIVKTILFSPNKTRLLGV